ncbi:MAG: hypothetical protein AAGC55_18320, partial [Myxococcota bacterium]
ESSPASHSKMAGELSPDTYVNIMGQYSPQYEVGAIARNGEPKYPGIARKPRGEEMRAAHAAASAAGLWRIDERWQGRLSLSLL